MYVITLILTGICAYASINHAIIAFDRPYSKKHLLFSALCAILFAYEYLHGLTYIEQSLTKYIFYHRLELTVLALFFGFWPWFFVIHAGIQAKNLLIALRVFSATCLVLSLYNLTLPYSLQYSVLDHLSRETFPWGEVFSKPVGQISSAFSVPIVMVLLSTLTCLYIAWSHYQREKNRTNLALLVAIGAFIALATQAILIRIALIDSINLGHIGIFLIVFAMSLVLNQELRNNLHHSETRWRSLVEQSPFSHQIMSPSGATLLTNPAWEKLWGVRADQLKGYNILQDEQLKRKGVMPYIKKGFAGSATEIPVIVYNPAENTVFKGPQLEKSIRGFIYPILDQKHKVNEVVILHEDVTEKQRFDDAIRFIATGVSAHTGEDFFKDLVKSLADLFSVKIVFLGVLASPGSKAIRTRSVLMDGKFVDNITYELHGTPCENVVGQSTCVVPNNVQQLFPEDHLLVEMNAQNYIGAPIMDPRGEPLGIVVLINYDSSHDTEKMQAIMELIALRAAAELEREKADELLRQRQTRLQDMVDRRTSELRFALQELEAFSYSVSHDLKSPLRSISGFGQVLVEDYQEKLDEQGKDYINRINQNVNRMSLLIDDMMKLSHVSRDDLHKTEVNLSQMVSEQLKRLRDMEPYRRVDCRIEDNVMASGDANLLELALDNLVANAWKYSRNTPDAKIEFGRLEHKQKPTFYIKDNGAGFDMSKAGSLFTEFRRLHTQKEFEGTGIGLAIVARVIKRHGGRIWAEAKPNQGATFYFTLE